MVQLTLFPDNTPGPRWIAPPWTTAADRWVEIDRDLPPEDPARRIAELVAELDLTALHGSYAGLGSPAYPPELLVRLVLFEIHRGCLSPAQWCQDCRRDEAVKWLLFGLRPSRSCLYQFRERIGPYLDAWNRQILQTAQAEGATPAQRAALDGTFVAAAASRHTLISAETLAQRCQQLDEALARDFAAAAGQPPAPAPAAALPPAPAPAAALPPAPAPAAAPTAPGRAAPAWMARTPSGRFRQRQRYRHAHQQMTQRQRHRRQTLSRRAKAKRHAPERIRINPSEPEAVLGRDKTKVFRPLYNVQLACDLDSDFILGSGVFAATTDANLFVPLMEQTGAHSGRMPQVVLNDGQYANILNLKFCRQQQITMYAPVPQAAAVVAPSLPKNAPGEAVGPGAAESPRPAPPPRVLPKAAFTWLPEQKTYRCPAGHLLVWQRRETELRAEGEVSYAQYRCPAVHCQGCPLRDRCTRSPQRGRTIKRSEHEDLCEALRQRMGQAEGQAVYRLRKQTVERQFADLKEHRSLRCFGSFGLERARAQVGLLVLAHNGLLWLKVRSQAAGKATPALAAGDG
jgi:transposase